MKRTHYVSLRLLLGIAGAGAVVASAPITGRADKPLPPPMHHTPPEQMTPAEKAATAQARAAIQAIYDKMDAAVARKDQHEFLLHRDPTYAEVDHHGAWRSATNCRGDVVQLFSGLLSAKGHSRVQAVWLNGSHLAEVFVSRHCSMVVKDPQTKLYTNRLTDTVCRDIFQLENGQWVQYRSYHMAEQVYVNGKRADS